MALAFDVNPDLLNQSLAALTGSHYRLKGPDNAPGWRIDAEMHQAGAAGPLPAKPGWRIRARGWN